ncbi:MULTISPECIES: hypothetical protein [Bacillus cereus group]|uniref:hypothetical protein n=1 Tax=Bacillus cereus group TaxID=86661 RepID=UPI001596E8AB|nr:MULTISPECIES: hypothetical protein [Bacillus cereus group]MDA1763109.1 hypothetical protein [Bacillus cereus]
MEEQEQRTHSCSFFLKESDNNESPIENASRICIKPSDVLSNTVEILGEKTRE